MIGTSATAAAIVSAVHSVPRAKREEADRLRAKTGDLRKLFDRLASIPLSERKEIESIGARRAEIIVGGAAVFIHTSGSPGAARDALLRSRRPRRHHC